MEFQLAKSFTDTLIEERGESGRKWLDKLPSIVQKSQEKWGFTLEANSYELYTNFICPIRFKDGKKAVLKIGFPGDEGVPTEMESLQYFTEQYSVQLLENDAALVAFIIEKLNPGTALRNVHLNDDAEATSLALPLLQNVIAPVPKKHSFPTLADWSKVIMHTKNISIKGNVTSDILDKAQAIFDELDESKENDMLLHGDLHHDNILLDEEKGWIAIDPKGVIGDPAYNGSRFIINNWSKKESRELLPSRVEAIAETLGYNQRRIAGWAYVDLVLSNCWSLEGGKESKIDTAFAEALASYMD
jgi:streptomycin 6-kinase